MTTEMEQLGRAVKAAQYRHHRAADRSLTEVGSSLAQWDALRAISWNPGGSAHDLALATFQGDQSFGTLAMRLERQGLVERRAGHGRRIEHRLTDAGERMLLAGRAAIEGVLARSFAGLDAEEQATLLTLLERVGEPLD